uniref:Replication factor A C-terminal domain-containing protein n=1 Tax=Brassica oleracea var. oleracea TaxID=109376 RepID=A0A0D3CG74_BRAOL
MIFFLHTTRKTIAEMIECRQVEKCIVMCTIAAIDSDMGWYYLSCKVCSKKVQYEPPLVTGDHDDDDLTNFKIYCAKCKCYDPKLLPSYKLHLVVLDNTGTSKFPLFDNLALQLVHQPCIELTRPVTDEIQYPDVIPLALQNLVGRTYLFKVEILRENFVYKHDTFKVNKIITNLDIIREFDTPKVLEDQGIQTLELENSVISDAPEGSLMLLEEPSSQQGGPSDLTPAKRRGGPVVNLEEEFDQNSVTKMGITTRIKKEKFDKSG